MSPPGERNGAARVLVSGIAWERFAGILRPAAPGLEWCVLHDDGTVANGGAHAEIAWLSNDVFYSGALPVFVDVLRDDANLAWVQSAGAGVDSPLFRSLLDRGIRLTTTHATSIPIAEYVVGMVLRRYQRPELWGEAASQREWRHTDFPEVWGTTWLIVGVGHIGREIAIRARTFGAHVIGVRRAPRGDEPVDRMIAPADVLDVLPDVDVVVLAAPATDETQHLVDAQFLAAMRERALLINVARGSLVDEEALIAALDGGRPAHAVLDVTEVEPLPPASPLWAHPNVTITPHTSGGGDGRFLRAAEVFAANLGRFVRGEPLVDEIGAPT